MSNPEVAKESRTFMTRRYCKVGNVVDSAPPVVALQYTKLQVSQIEVCRWTGSSAIASTSTCPVHKGCNGHIQLSSSGHMSMPQFMINEVLDVPDPKSRLHLQLMQGMIDPEDFGIELTKLCSGKKGIIRSSLVTSSPVCTVRGVATCSWNQYQHIVLIPKKWWHRLKIPIVKSNVSVLGGEYPISWTFESAQLNNHEFGFILRCPSINDDSLQPVIVKYWDGPSIRVHPEMCKNLHLDFDGDEVHIGIVRREDSVNEIKQLLSELPSFKFTPGVWRKHLKVQRLSRSIRRTHSSNVVDWRSEHSDFMVYSTTSITNVCTTNAPSAYFKYCNVKEHLLPNVRKSYEQGADVTTFCRRSNEALRQVAISHLTVAQGHTFGRQLKNLCFQNKLVDGSFRFMYSGSTHSQSVVSTTMRSSLGQVRGFPGARLASRLSSVIMQASLDVAKHTTQLSGSDLLLSLFRGRGVSRYWLMNLVSHTARIFDSDQYPVLGPGTICVATTNRSYLKAHCNPTDSMVMLSMCLIELCKIVGCRYTIDEINDLAVPLFVSTIQDPIPAISDTMPIRYMETLNLDFLNHAICVNVYGADDIHNSDSGISSARNPIVAIVLGNVNML